MMPPLAKALSAVDPSTLHCEACSVYDPSLRCSSHPTILSFLVGTTDKARAGLWCARCRALQAMKAIAISLVAGWWSPRGPKLTFDALRANLKGGVQQPAVNAQLLRSIAQFEHGNENPDLAAMFARAAQTVQPQIENRRFLESLERAGHRIPFRESPWRFAPFLPVVVFAIAIIAFGTRIMTGDDAETAVAAIPIQHAALVPPKRSPAAPVRTWTSRQSADELEKELKSNSDRALASAYLRARLREVKDEIPLRVRRGDSIWPLETSVISLGSNSSLAPVFANSRVTAAYETLVATMREATRYYHGGATVEVMERHAGETMNVTVAAAFTAIDADLRGQEGERDAAASQANSGAFAIAEMRRDLRIRGAVISTTTRAIDDCLRLLGDSP